MKIEVRHRCADFNGYRAALVKSLFNCESGANFSLDAELPIDDGDWRVGLVVGPSGSGKSSIGRALAGFVPHDVGGWPADAPIIEAIAPGGAFDAATGALSAVGLGSVPSWLRPFHALSTGEQFRAGLARLLCDAPERVVVDEFTSVVDRQIAKVGAGAFAKAWRRGTGQVVLLSCHRDIIDWLEPDWVFDTASGAFARGSLWRRPRIDVQIWRTDWSLWPLFEPHHYLKLPRMICAQVYVATVAGAPVAHLAVSPRFEIGNAVRACRMVVLPEWQGSGVGTRFLNAVCELQLRGRNRWRRKAVTYFHTSHPGLAAALRRDPRWAQCSAVLYGGDKAESARSIAASANGGPPGQKGRRVGTPGYGGHFRAVQGFKFGGPRR